MEISILQLLQVTVMKLELKGFETVIEALYLSSRKPFKGVDFETLIGLLLSSKFIFDVDPSSKHRDWNSILNIKKGWLLLGHIDRNIYSISALNRPTCYLNRRDILPDVHDIFLLVIYTRWTKSIVIQHFRS